MRPNRRYSTTIVYFQSYSTPWPPINCNSRKGKLRQCSRHLIIKLSHMILIPWWSIESRYQIHGRFKPQSQELITSCNAIQLIITGRSIKTKWPKHSRPREYSIPLSLSIALWSLRNSCTLLSVLVVVLSGRGGEGARTSGVTQPDTEENE